MGGKLDDAYLGPNTVAEVVYKGRYQLQNESGKKLKKLYNGVLLKEYFPVKESTESQPDVKESTPDVDVKQPDESSPPKKKRKVCVVFNVLHIMFISKHIAIIYIQEGKKEPSEDKKQDLPKPTVRKVWDSMSFWWIINLHD